jgi:NAD(P)-dependent dehydrogenase (short-subunit alcohol dehydrogenase family)
VGVMRETDFDVTGKVVIVTGADFGIGRGVALMLADAGATVVPTVLEASNVEDLHGEAGARGSEVRPIGLDLTDVAMIRSVVEAIRAEHGRIDVLFNNAGLGFGHPAFAVTEADWDQMMAVNLRGLFFMSQAVASVMKDQGGGRIINMSSQGGLVGLPQAAVYCATKGGVNTLTKQLALEWGPCGINVNGLAPAFVETPGTKPILDDPVRRADFLSHIPLGHVAAIDDIAAAVIYLASNAGRMLTGTILSVDGGWTAQ